MISRESARLLEQPLSELIVGPTRSDEGKNASRVTVDFEAVEGMAPSFLDELLTVFEALIRGGANGQERALVVAHAPTRLSSKFEAVARGHGMTVRAMPDGSWLLTDAPTSRC